MDTQRTVYCMNLKDNRDPSNKSIELKFKLCFEKSMIAIGWSVPETVNTWEEYKEIANQKWLGAKNYSSARNNLERLKKEDLVWVKNPLTNERYLVEITDEYPGIYSSLKEFDTCAYRKGDFHLINETWLTDALSANKLRARATLEQKHREDTYTATIKLFENLKVKSK